MNLNIESNILSYLTYKNKIKYSKSINNNRMLENILNTYHKHSIFKKIKKYKKFKLILLSNKLSIIPHNDAAVWRRIHIIPFESIYA